MEVWNLWIGETPFESNFIKKMGGQWLYFCLILTHFRKNMTSIHIRIMRWLMQLKVWIFVGPASTVVGLLCFALSSSFNHLFGEWNLLKIFLYSVFSFIICLLILYANRWQHSRSLRFKAHTAFLVLTITSIYSFFFDKVMNGKPDAYSLISCAAFAIMSLSLSRQTHCGFEVDLMYFYLGCLMVQLMKIKLPLAIVGAGYSYCLIILRSSFSSLNATPKNEHLEDQRVVIQVDSKQLANTNNGGSTTQQFLTCIKELLQNNSNLANMLLERVKDNSELVVTDHNFIIDALPPEIINNLHKTAKLMVDAGFEKECSDMYSCCRRELLEELLIKKILVTGRMGFQDYMIGRWIKASKVALRILFPSERRLYDHVFSGISSASDDLCFSEVCRGATIQLLNFANSFANGSPSAWRFFKILDLFKTLRELIPEFQSLFPDSLVNEAIKVQNRLGEVSRDIFMEFGNLIFHTLDAELDVSADGGVHPMTHEAKGYLIFAFWSRQVLEQILQEYPVAADGVGTSSFYAQMERIMEQLERKLEAKSKIYEDPALSYFFMMNNLSYVEYHLRNLGDGRFSKNTGKHFELYCRSSWNKVIDFLKMDSNESVAPNVAAESMKDKLNLFNQHFREMCNIQSTWSAFDKQLREQIIISLDSFLLPAYENFIERFQDVLGKHAHEQIEYGISDIKDRLSHLFKKEGWQNLCEARTFSSLEKWF